MPKSKLFLALAVPAALVALYALLGFQLAPGLVRDQAQQFVRDTYGRELSVGEVRVQPFKLQLEIRQLALPDADGQPMLGVERLFVDLEIASLWQRALTLRAVTVESPRVRAVVRPGGTLNLADLAPRPAAGHEPAPDKPLPAVWVQQFTVGGGQLEFVDQNRRQPFARQLRDVGFTLADFRTTPQGGEFQFSARGHETTALAWKGRVALAPAITSEGTFEVSGLPVPGLLEFLGEAVPFQSATGTLQLSGTYRAALAEKLQLDLNLPNVALRDVGLRARGETAPWVQIPSLVVSDVQAALPARTLRVQRLAVDGLRAQAVLRPDGSLNLAALLDGGSPEGSAKPPSPAPSPPAKATAPEGAWAAQVGEIAFTNAAVDVEDQAHAPGTRLRIAPLDLRVSGASLDLAQPLSVAAGATIDADTRLDVQGTLTPAPFAARLDLRLAKARLALLKPYVLPQADLTVNAGWLGVAGELQVALPPGQPPAVRFLGDVEVEGFKSVDNAQRQDFLNVAMLQLRQVRFASSPAALGIARIDIREPYARVIISPEQVLNVSTVLAPPGTASAPDTRRPGARPPTAGAAGALAVTVGEVRVDRMRLNFTDNFVQPNFSADVQRLTGQVRGLSSAAGARARVDLTGTLGEFSPVKIEGQLEPFAFDRFTDLQLRFQGIQLPIFNPYSGSLAGYQITKGQLDTTLRYRIQDRRLDAQHQLRIDQLEWGDAVSGKQEATLPVKFATALLKDRNGVIDLDLPVGGTLDDPSFRIAPIVWQIVKNLIVKAVTAPFAVLGSLFAGAEAAQFVDFQPGDAVLDATAAARLAALGKSLGEKPALKLDVPIGTVAELDRPALAERAYQAALAAIPAYATLDPGRKIAALTAALRARTGSVPKLPDTPAPPPGAASAAGQALRDAAAVAALEQALRASFTVAPAELAELGEARARAVQRALLTDTGLDPARVFKVLDARPLANDGRVRLALALK